MSSYIGNAGWIFLEKIVRIIVGFLLFAMVSRVLGPTEFGVLSFSQTMATMLICITGLGLDNILIKEFSASTENENKIFSTALISRIIVSFLLLVLMLLPIFLYDTTLENKIVFFVCSVSLIFQSQNTYFSYYQAKSKSLFITKLSLVSLLISSVIKIYLIYTDVNTYLFALSFTADFAIGFFIIYFVAKKNSIYPKLMFFDLSTLKELIKQAWPIIISSILIVLYTRLDQIMIAKMLGAESVGIFNVAIRISDAYIFIPTALATSFYPLIARSPTKKNVRFYFDIIYSSALFSGLAVIAASYYAIPLLFGAAYEDSFDVLSITIFSSVFAVLGGACTNFLIILNLTYMRLVRAVIGLIINFVLNIFWIPKYGIVGAAYASLVSQVFAAWLGNATNKRSFECFLWQTQSIITFGLTGLLSLVKSIGYKRGKGLE